MDDKENRERALQEVKMFQSYTINMLGDVYSNLSNKFLKKESLKGYERVTLSVNNQRYKILVHRLVAKAFIPNPDNKPFVNHKNGIKNDNRVENLEWCTNQENIKHSFDVLGRKGSSTNRFGKLHHSSKKVNQYDKKGNFIKLWDCISDVERNLNINHSSISQVCIGTRFSAGGFKWKHQMKN